MHCSIQPKCLLILIFFYFRNNSSVGSKMSVFFFFFFRWLICSLAVRVFQSALGAELKIRSVGLFSVQGVSIQFHPQHTLVRHTVFT